MSQDSPQPYQVDQVEGVTVVKVVGNQIAPDTKDALYAVAEGSTGTARPRQVVLNMANVRILNSAAIGILINFQRKVRDAGGTLEICAIDPYVLDLFRLTKMDQVLDIHGTQQDAIDAFHGKARPSSSGGKRSWFARIFGSK
jgi:anti-sigma B factor antagonist